MEESLERAPEKEPAPPQMVKVLGVLAYIGNGLWGLIFLGVFFWFMAAAEQIEEMLGVSNIPVASFAVFILILEFMFILCILGVWGMSNGRKSGFWIYVVGNILWVVVNLLSGQLENVSVALVSVAFVVGFATQLKKLN